MKKKLFALITAVSMLVSSIGVYAADSVWNDGILMASIRETYTELGYTVEWDAENEAAVIYTDNGTIIIPKNQSYIYINDRKVYGKRVQEVINGKLYAPAALIAKSLGTELETQGSSASISINGRTAVIGTAADTAAGTVGAKWRNSAVKEYLDINASPKDDFAMAANAGWAKTAVIPSGYGIYYKTDETAEIIDKRVNDILTDKTLTGPEADAVQGLYSALMDWDARAGIPAEYAEYIKEIEDIDSLTELSDYLTESGASPFLPMAVAQNVLDTSGYALFYSYQPLILGYPEEYEDLDPADIKIYYPDYVELMEKLMEPMGFSAQETDRYIEDAIKFDMLCAPLLPTREDDLDPYFTDRLYKKTSIAELDKAAGDYPLAEITKTCGFEASNAVIEHLPGYTAFIGSIYNEDNLELLKANIIVNSVFDSADLSDKAAYDAYSEFYENTYAQEMLPYSDYAAYVVRSVLYDPLNKLYSEKYGNDVIRNEVKELCSDIIDEYKIMISNEEGISEQTKEKAIEKLDAMRINVGYPDKYLDCTGLNMRGMDLLECMDTYSYYMHDLECSHINAKYDPDYWETDVLEENAYYDFSQNSINILWGEIAAFYASDLGHEELYGGLGCTIGHEISHAFDPDGALIDKNGHRNDWWTAKDKKLFDARMDKLVDYYDNIKLYTGEYCSGNMVKSEALADMTGMKCMLGIAAKEKDFDYKKFFNAFAHSWAAVSTDYYQRLLISEDTHPLTYLRVNTVLQQFDEFINTYDIKPGDGMYLAPEDRVLIW